MNDDPETEVVQTSSEQPSADGPQMMRQTGKKKLLRIVLFTGSALFGLLALLLAGAALGQYFWPSNPPAPIILSPQSGGESDIENEDILPMPNLFGLDEATVRLVLDAHGLGTLPVTISKKPLPGESGIVAEQTPLPGTKGTEVKKIELVLTDPLLMDDYTGRTIEDATAELEALNVAVIVKPFVTGAEEPGIVVGTVPEAGQQMPSEVEIQVADPGEAIFVHDTNTKRDFTGNCGLSVGTIKAGGQKMERYAYCKLNDSDGEILLTPGRKATLLRFDAALSDDSLADTAHITIIGDGNVLHEFDVTRGQIVPVMQRIPEVFDLSIRVSSPPRVTTVLGGIRYSVDPRNLGDLR